MSTITQTESKEPATTFVSFRCSEEQRRRIKVEAASRGISLQEMLTKAVEMYLEEPLGNAHG